MDDDKRALRERMRQRRAALTLDRAAAARLAANRFMGQIAVPSGAVVAGYCAVRDELDPAPLLRRLRQSGARVVLPAVTAAGAPLRFRLWQSDTAPPPGAFGIPAPGEDCAEAAPAIVLVPLLAFDRAGWRLGYGGGYYDRTLPGLGRALAVGYAFAAQEVPAVPHGAGDARLDWVVTEQDARRFE